MPGFQYTVVGHVLQVVPYFPFHQPCKRVEPTGDTHQFADDNIYGVLLPGMRSFVSKDLA